MNGDLQGNKVTQLSGQHSQIMRSRRGGDSQISESGVLALAARRIREFADTRAGKSKGSISQWFAAALRRIALFKRRRHQ
jgi:hypothetical protein